MELDLGDVSYAKVKFAGKEYKVREPNVHDVEILSEKLSKVKDDSQNVVILKDFLDGLGFPRADVDKLTVRKMSNLVEFLSGSKKN